jgi:hypothetical protein
MLPEDNSSSFIITESKDSLPGPPRKYISANGEPYKNWPICNTNKYQMLVACMDYYDTRQSSLDRQRK